MHASSEEQTIFGYLSAVESAEYGYFGGYLIVSSLGRPLEFHCTAPVRTNRAQDILYGPTLRSYLLGEQISSALLSAAQLTPQLILTDQPEAISAQRPTGIPMVLVLPLKSCEVGPTLDRKADDFASSRSSKRPNGERRSWSSPLAAFDYEVRYACGSESRPETIMELLTILAEGVDLSEPFGRIHEAIREAQRIGGQGIQEPGQAA
jgi:hypothetical protein